MAVAFPTWAYNLTQPAVIVATQAQFNALPGSGWALTPFASSTSSIPTDPGLTDTDIRLQQILIENRVSNILLQSMAAPALDSVDLTGLRADVLAVDSGLTT